MSTAATTDREIKISGRSIKMGDTKSALSRAAWTFTVWVMLLQFVGRGYMCLADKEEGFSKDSFPLGFAFGVAGSSYQYEGGAREGGRGPSIWDTFSHIPGNIKDGKNGDVAADSYHRYKEDVKLLKELGMDSYRFSISWSRILPNGTVEGGINREGIQYYNNLIDETVKHGIKPFATLFHWDLPQALEDKYKGFLDPDIVQDFKKYAELCFMEFGDRVKHWITMNEPLSYAVEAYVTGVQAPGRCSKFHRNCSEGNSGVEPYIVAHHILLAHAAAVDVYRQSFQSLQNGSIGITLNTKWMVPYTNSPRDVRASLRYLDFNFGWFINPLSEGDYPVSMRALVRSRLPRFTDKQKELVKGSFDFLGINYYTASYVSHASVSPNPSQPDYYSDSRAQTSYVRNGVPIGERAASDWLYIYPQGIHDLLLYIKNRYNNPPIYITENGVDEFDVKDVPLETVLNDTTRVNYHAQHLKLVRDALMEGADVRGYFAWSLLDNFEWADGYTVRFGLYYVDFNSGTLNRYPKTSVHWFQNFLKPNTHRNAW